MRSRLCSRHLKPTSLSHEAAMKWCRGAMNWVGAGVSRPRRLDPSFERYLLLMNPRSSWSLVKSVDDLDQICYDLCEGGTKERQGAHFCEGFLDIYAAYRNQPRESLGLEEKEAKRAVNHSRTLLDIWRLPVSCISAEQFLSGGRDEGSQGVWGKQGLQNARAVTYNISIIPKHTAIWVRIGWIRCLCLMASVCQSDK